MNDWRFLIALRYAFAGKSEQLVSFMSGVSSGGLELGVAVLVIVLSVMNGFDEELRTRVLGVIPHGVIHARDGSTDWSRVADVASRHPQVVAVAPLVAGSGLVVVDGEPAGVAVTGIDPVQEARVSIVADYMIEGTFDNETLGSFSVIIGQHLANRLGVGVGDRMTLVLPEISVTLAGPMPRIKRLIVGGIFRTGSDLDKSQLYLSIEDARRLLRGSAEEGLRVRVTDLFIAPAVLQELIYSLGDRRLYAVSWMRSHGSLYDAIQMQKATMFVLLSLLVAVAAFNVISNLMLMVKTRQSDIAILRSAGATPAAIRRLFLVLGLLLGVMGLTLGLVLGVLVAANVSSLYAALDNQLGLGLMDEYFIQYLPSVIFGSDIVVVALVSMVICLVAAIYPASRAARVEPAEVLKHDV